MIRYGIRVSWQVGSPPGSLLAGSDGRPLTFDSRADAEHLAQALAQGETLTLPPGEYSLPDYGVVELPETGVLR